MKTLAIIKGMLAALLVMLILLVFSSTIPGVTAGEEHITAMNYQKPIPLSNDNLVDILSDYMDTRNLHTIHMRHGVLQVELLLHNDEPFREQVYATVPQYIVLAFQFSSNVDQLKLNVLQQGRKTGEELQLIQLTVHAEDPWLQDGVQALQNSIWLEQVEWIKQLRIEKSIFWLKQYEV